MNEVTQKRINNLRRSMQNVSNASARGNDIQKRAAFRFMTERVLELREYRDALAVKLDAGWDHLGANPSDKNEDRWIGWLREYEAMCDVLNDADHHAGMAA